MLDLTGIPPTQMLYYEDAYVKEFDSNVIRVLKTENYETGVILDETAFYPGGGGQPPDIGLIKGDTMQAKVVGLKRKGEIIIHYADEVFGEIREGAHARGIINWERRYRLMRIHTSAHLMSQAIRQALVKPVEIASSGMDLEKARLDFAHAGSTREFFPKIETIANHVVEENRIVKIMLMLRNEAEDHAKKFHESLKTLPPQVSQVRIVEITGWHACACGGTHVKSTGEIGEIRLLSRSSKGKGIERIEFTVQKP